MKVRGRTPYDNFTAKALKMMPEHMTKYIIVTIWKLAVRFTIAFQGF